MFRVSIENFNWRFYISFEKLIFFKNKNLTEKKKCLKWLK